MLHNYGIAPDESQDTVNCFWGCIKDTIRENAKYATYEEFLAVRDMVNPNAKFLENVVERKCEVCVKMQFYITLGFVVL